MSSSLSLQSLSSTPPTESPGVAVNPATPSLQGSSLYEAPLPAAAAVITEPMTQIALNPSLAPSQRSVNQLVGSTHALNQEIASPDRNNDIIVQLSENLIRWSQELGRFNVAVAEDANALEKLGAAGLNFLPDAASFLGQVGGYLTKYGYLGTTALFNEENRQMFVEGGQAAAQLILDNVDNIPWDQVAAGIPGFVKDTFLATVASMATGNLSETWSALKAVLEDPSLLNRAILAWEAFDTIKTWGTVIAVGAAVVAGGPIAWGVVGAFAASELAEIVIKTVAKETMQQTGKEITQNVSKNLTEEAIERIGKAGSEAMSEHLLKEVREALGDSIDIDDIAELTAEQLDEVMNHIVQIPANADAYREMLERLHLTEEFAELTEEQLRQAALDPNGSLWTKIRQAEFDRTFSEGVREAQVDAIRQQLNEEIANSVELQELYARPDGSQVTFETIIEDQVYSDLSEIRDLGNSDRAIQDYIRRRGLEQEVTPDQVRAWQRVLNEPSNQAFRELKEDMTEALTKEMTADNNELRQRILDSTNRQWDETINGASHLTPDQRAALRETGHRAARESYDEAMSRSVREGMDAAWRRLEEDRNNRRRDRDGVQTEASRPDGHDTDFDLTFTESYGQVGNRDYGWTQVSQESGPGYVKNDFFDELEMARAAADQRSDEVALAAGGSAQTTLGDFTGLRALEAQRQNLEASLDAGTVAHPFDLTGDAARERAESSFGLSAASHSRHASLASITSLVSEGDMQRRLVDAPVVIPAVQAA